MSLEGPGEEVLPAEADPVETSSEADPTAEAGAQFEALLKKRETDGLKYALINRGISEWGERDMKRILDERSRDSAELTSKVSQLPDGEEKKRLLAELNTLEEQTATEIREAEESVQGHVNEEIETLIKKRTNDGLMYAAINRGPASDWGDRDTERILSERTRDTDELTKMLSFLPESEEKTRLLSELNALDEQNGAELREAERLVAENAKNQ